tara:strand:- start:287 stop:610 length:324 start_codon:yes stop_codon:yes gene_type:complete
MKIMLRGIPVEVRGNNVYVTINKPQKGMFSLSDKIKEYIDTGHNVFVEVDGETQIINKKISYAFKENVKSKFPTANDWSRYWYSIDKNESLDIETGAQLELFAQMEI